MSYYMGDYYTGDYYAGDPGFFSFLKKAVGTVAGFIPGVGGIAQKAIGAIGGGGVKALPGAVMKMPGVGTQILRRGVKLAKKPGVIAAAGALGAGAIGYAAGRRGAGAATGAHRRRINVTNVKALRRSIRRCQGFAKLAKRVLRFTSPRPPRGRVTFKHARRKRTV